MNEYQNIIDLDHLSSTIGRLQGYLNILQLPGLSNEVISYLLLEMISLDKLLAESYDQAFISPKWALVEKLLWEVHHEASNYIKKDFNNDG